MLRLKAIYNIITNRPVIANCEFVGGIRLVRSRNGVIINNRFGGN